MAKSLDQPLSQPLLQWQERGHMLTLLGKKIFVIDEGEPTQPNLVLIHGFPTSSWDWLPIWEALRHKFRIITLDMHGFGFSEKPNQRNYSIGKQADIIEALVSTLEIQEYGLLVHDYGNSVAQEILYRHHNQLTDKGQVRSCCFLNGGLFPETHKALLIQKLLLSPIGKYLNALSGYSQFKKSFSSVFGSNTKPTEAELKNFWQVINFNKGKHIFHNGITYINDRIENRDLWLDTLQNSRIPLALINGSVDPVSGKHLVDRYKELECRLDYLKELPDIGHYPQVEAPQDVSNAYFEFISNQK